jgi:hypothetical protein
VSILQPKDFLSFRLPINLSCSLFAMAIYSSVPPQEQEQSATTASASGINIEAWTVSALQSLNVSDSPRGTGATLSIPLHTREDEDYTPKHLRPRSIPRDSQKRREALLKGKEGSRRRQRWENGMWSYLICQMASTPRQS